MQCINDGVERRLYGAALRISEDEDFARHFVAERSLSDSEAQRIAELSAVVAQKWNVNAKYAPELALVVAVGGYGSRVYFAVRKLEALHQEKMQREIKASKSQGNPPSV